MNRRWFVGAWALLGTPATIFLVGYLEKVLSYRSGLAFILVAVLLPGACIGLGLLSVVSLVKPGLPRAAVACLYGVAIYVLTQAVANPVVSTHAEIWVPK